MSKEKQIESTDWLTRGIPKEQLEPEKQIDRLTVDIANMPNSVDCIVAEAEYLYSKGWRKQSEGEWVYGENDIPHCSECGHEPKEISPFCPICGAKMEGGAE